MADSYGRKRVYLLSAGLFLAGSLLCGMAWSMMSLIFFRAVQGIGGGGLVPLASTIIGDVSEPAERPRMMGYVAGIWGISAIVGPLLGAFFVNSLGWPFVFWVNLPIGISAMAMVARFLHEPPRTGRHQPIDVPGAALLGRGCRRHHAGVGANRGVKQRADHGLFGLRHCSAAGVHLARAARDRSLAADSFAASADDSCCQHFGGRLRRSIPGPRPLSAGVGSRGHGGNALLAGVVLGVLCIGWTSTTMTLGRHLARLSFRPVAIIGSIALVTGSFGLLTVAAGQSIVRLCICCVFIGVGLSVNSLISTVAVQSSVARAERGRAMGLYYFSRLIGQALGAAAFGGVLNHGLKLNSGSHDIVRELVDSARRSALAEPELNRLIETLAHALHSTFILTSILAVVALIVTLFIPRQEQLGQEE